MGESAATGATALDVLERTIGIAFHNRALLRRALTHASYLNENPDYRGGDNERLEYLGDAVGDFIAAELVFHRFPNWDEGALTSLRSQLVCSETLAGFAREIDLGRFLLLGRGEEQSGGRSRDAMLSDAFEALLGAVYVDQGLEVARRLLLRFLEPHIAAAGEPGSKQDAKTRLQEWTQARHHQAPTYITVQESGPDHARQFIVKVEVLGQVRGSGVGRSKQAAEQAAARAALAALTEKAADS